MKQPVLSQTEISPGVFLLSVERRFDFLPGQTVKISVDDGQPPRIYSICSGNRDAELKILYNVKNDGRLTPQLAHLKPGDPVEISEPGGSFIGTNEPAVWIATGTGIAPFYSMLRSGLVENKVLVHGVKRANQFYFSRDWKKALGVHYHRFCSQEEGDEISCGRVNRFLETEHFSKGWKYYLCGQAEMCVEMRDLLIAKGIPFSRIVAEIYF